MATNYIIRAPKDAVANGEQPSMRTANIDLSAANWSTGQDPAALGDTYLCPRAFVPNYSGTLVFKAAQDSSDVTMIVNAGQVYPIAIRSITQASCSAALKVTNAIAIMY
jgi:hypothetical protein